MSGPRGAVRFAKLHGAGNDFILFDGRAGDADRDRLAPRVAALCRRRLGIGADGVLLVEPQRDGEVRLTYWNADGSEAAFCGNGTRCAARFVAERWGWRRMTVLTGYAPVEALVDGAAVELELPPPSRVDEWRTYRAAGGEVDGRYLVVGVPHLAVPTDWRRFWEHPFEPLGPELRGHPDLPAGGANVNVFQVTSAAGLAVRSWERGVEGETLASGSGVVATALTALAAGMTSGPVRVETASGRFLDVTAGAEPLTSPVKVRGPAEWVAEGVVAAELLAAG